jgi:type IV pilus assembly protein PilE
MAQASPAAGFTLIELVIALAIVAITTLIAASSYRSHVVRSHRAEAAQALLAAAAEQEKFHLSHGHYGERLDSAAGQEPPGLPVASRTPRGHFELAVDAVSGSTFRIVATAAREDADSACRSMSIDESGRRSATDAQGRDSTQRCW